MTQGIKWLYLLTLAVWIGSIVFFSFVVAPTVFKTLKPEDAASLIRRIFSQYYLVGCACGAVAMVCVGMLAMRRSFGLWPAVCSLILIAAMTGTDLWLRQSVMPHMNELRERRAAATPPLSEVEAEWKALHRLSVQLNGAVLFAGLTLVFLVVFARVV